MQGKPFLFPSLRETFTTTRMTGKRHAMAARNNQLVKKLSLPSRRSNKEGFSCEDDGRKQSRWERGCGADDSVVDAWKIREGRRREVEDYHHVMLPNKQRQNYNLFNSIPMLLDDPTTQSSLVVLSVSTSSDMCEGIEKILKRIS